MEISPGVLKRAIVRRYSGKIFLTIFCICLRFLLTGKNSLSENPPTDLSQYKIKPPEDIGYLPFPVQIMDRYTQEAYTFDPWKGEIANISYRVTKLGWIRLRLVRKDQKDLILRTLQDWAPRKYGTTYQIKWDGRDASGNIIDNKKIFILFEAKDQGDVKLHENHPEEKCKDSKLEIVQPKAGSTVKEKTLIKAVFNENPAGYGDEVGYEVSYYIDYRFLRKERYGKDQKQFDFLWDTNALENGEHMVTININDLHDHVGTASIKLKVQN